MKERDRLIREKKRAMRKRMDELDNEEAANSGNG
jgi:hypothetical protein